MVEQHNQKIRREDRRSGVITEAIRRIFGDKTARTFDFFPEHKEQSPKQSSNLLAKVAEAKALKIFGGAK